MNETNTTNSSSAVAVADGASAAAHTKTVGAEPMKSSSQVKLLIKSSNQQYEDHVIESDLLWTVKRLKSHLSMVYPSKPPAADQKLIYSGHLLNDNVQLKDVIRSYKDVYTHNHIIHLVYTPKNLPPPAISTVNKVKITGTSSTANGIGGVLGMANDMTTVDGLRQRHTSDNNSTGQQSTSANMQQQQQQQQQQSVFHQQIHPYFMTAQLMSASGMTNCPQIAQSIGNGFGVPFNVQTMISQQAAMYNWMQQVYSQYIEQCLRLSNTVGDTGHSTTTTSFPTIPPNFQQLFQQQFSPTVMTMTPVVSDPTNSAPINTAAGTNVAVVEDREQQQQQRQEQQALAQVVAPRFPNLAQDEQDNRDWLDSFFSITRLVLFLTLLYFNSSPLRCLVVVIIVSGIYLYHIGILRLRHERNNNNLNRNNNAAQNAAVDQIRQGVDQQQNAIEVQGDNNENNDEGEQSQRQQSETTTTTTTDTTENDNNESSLMSTIRTFVVTFFTSLLPETPAL